MFDSFNDNHHDHVSPSQQTNGPDFVDIEIPHSVGIANSLEPTTPSVRIVSMQDSNTATTTHGGDDARREPVMDRTTTMRVSPCHPFSFLPLLPFLLPLLYTGLPFCVLPSRPRPSPDLPACGSNSCATSWKRASTSTNSLLILAPHMPLQTYLDFNAIYIVYP
ncbi:hypothetical protein BGY98DRAFT_1103975 [Russula aff. rugulosa BPL654]|nr:hypothetical protein BGY98DRAFT_1103975 [Russula aff. rugulosa BPL654]